MRSSDGGTTENKTINIGAKFSCKKFFNTLSFSNNSFSFYFSVLVKNASYCTFMKMKFSSYIGLHIKIKWSCLTNHNYLIQHTYYVMYYYLETMKWETWVWYRYLIRVQILSGRNMNQKPSPQGYPFWSFEIGLSN